VTNKFLWQPQPPESPSSSMEKACPSGCKYVGNGFAGVTVLQAATAFDAAYPWAQHRPPEAA
jgi:hypothetical protein